MLAEMQGVSKSFGGRQVVADVSFGARKGEVLGVVGPNGAGKTTSIRMLLDIIKPDSGSVRMFGRAPDDDAKAHIGYLPEDRGLYRNLRVWDTLLYLAALKGMSAGEAAPRARELLERVSLWEHRQKKVGELSRGMGQLIQFVTTILHRPALVVLDEPFAALDPLNVRLMKEMVAESVSQGTGVILCTHQMNQVEELCHRVVMINRGGVVLHGGVAEIKRQFSDNAVEVVAPSIPRDLRGVRAWQDQGGGRMHLGLDAGVKPQDVLKALVERGVLVEKFEVALPSMEDVFVRVARETT